MRIYQEGIEHYTPWSGAVDTCNAIIEYGKVDELETMLEELYPDGMSDTELNDLLWFEQETVCEWIGLYYNDENGEITDTEPEVIQEGEYEAS
jgi:hypothetical protein